MQAWQRNVSATSESSALWRVDSKQLALTHLFIKQAMRQTPSVRLRAL